MTKEEERQHYYSLSDDQLIALAGEMDLTVPRKDDGEVNRDELIKNFLGECSGCNKQQVETVSTVTYILPKGATFTPAPVTTPAKPCSNCPG